MANASVATGGDLIEKDECGTVFFAADNIDHNLASVKGNNMLHGMGMMAVITPGLKIKRVIPRRTISNDIIKELASVQIYEYLYDKKS